MNNIFDIINNYEKINNVMDFLDFDEYEDDNPEKKNERRKCIFKPRINYFDTLNDKLFEERFKISKPVFITILQKIKHVIRHDSDRNNAIFPAIQLMVALRFYASASFYVVIGDFSGISKASVLRIVHRVSNAIAALKDEYIKLPSTQQEIVENEAQFFQIAKFIHVMGCIDCTHIKIQSCGREDGEVYRNRKGYFSINTQVVINAKFEIIDIVARWPGSAHDSTIFDHSRIKTLFEMGRFGDSILLGDSGYPTLPYLMTPLLHPTTAAQHLYNESQIRTRSTVERFFGMWKRKFPVLAIGMRFNKIEKALAVIVATAVLYNVSIQQRFQNQNVDAYNNAIQQLYNANAINIHDQRQNLFLDYFHRLI
ncbi:PREDICTED: putative nuclease HARBI1 isoform X1 [Vollenhovia emeryi]|uniref:putative nuclease HARBI1 isoform X1 n=1 Tax=Vollenhovia emeryi TaxID=411798 RepID=UPI0005F46D54|nr:PREDICTED: putative nuclease HARBI1 isoform X1 [Vollenhovia emeryi]